MQFSRKPLVWVSASPIVVSLILLWLFPLFRFTDEISTSAKAETVKAHARPIVSGCAASACHGSETVRSLTAAPDERCWESAASHFTACDPHVRAYEALTSRAGEEIIRKLKEADSEHWRVDAANEVRCLACHVNPSLTVEVPDPARKSLRSEGVSCEACHGNAGDWIHKHMSWSHETRRSEYESTGMHALYDPGTRGMICAGCHVGAPADSARGYPVRDMNHDMIAAGHPRLDFELAEYQRRLRPHWLEKDRTLAGAPRRGTEFEAKLWLVGRIASMESACRLLGDRAARSLVNEAQWPEFAESNCFACHQEIRVADPKAPHRSARTVGSPQRQSIWPLTDRDRLAFLEQVPEWKSYVSKANEKLESLREAVESPSIPRAETVRDRANAASLALAEFRRIVNETPDQEVRKIVSEMLESMSNVPTQWDEACQALHGAASLARGTPSRHKKERSTREFEAAFRLLTPYPNRGERFPGVDRYNPEEYRTLFIDLMRSLSSSETDHVR